jgi:hypothetical protein
MEGQCLLCSGGDRCEEMFEDMWLFLAVWAWRTTYIKEHLS